MNFIFFFSADFHVEGALSLGALFFPRRRKQTLAAEETFCKTLDSWPAYDRYVFNLNVLYSNCGLMLGSSSVAMVA